MGGTFNPIHNGHLILAQKAYEQFTLDEVLFMPCGVPYMKSSQKVEDGQTRAQMTALAIRDIPYFKMSTMEIDQQGNTYTYRTLECLKKEHPDIEYYFILGADSLFHITSWLFPERILASCHILAAVRNGKTTKDMLEQIRILQHEYDAQIDLLNTECMDISSSGIRHKIAAGLSVEEDIPDSVRKYIEKRGLYR